jgi:hypothetical protein
LRGASCSIPGSVRGEGIARMRPLSNKRMEPPGAIVLMEAGRLCPSGQWFTFSSRARGVRVARGSCASR